MTTRREFLAAAAGSAVAMGLVPVMARAVGGRAAAPKKILVLGGTRFIGPHIVDAAKARGHAITLFNRGYTEKLRGEIIPGVEHLYGNRDPDKPADETKNEKGEYVTTDGPKGLETLKGRSWDAVIDTSGYYPRMVKASAELLAPHVKQYVFVSSVSVYASDEKGGEDESAAVGTMEDPTVETMGPEYKFYGPLKALCEQAAEKAFPGRCANVRPGYIVGPGDGTDRFSYWPLRVKKGGEVLAPGSPEDPIQIIDGRDLAAWLITLVEGGTAGTFNAVGPEKPLTMGGVLESCKKVSGSDARFTWVPSEFLEKDVPGEGLDLPIWAPATGKTAGFHRRSNARALKAGLTFRPLETIVGDILAWFPKEIDRRVTVTKRLREEAEKKGAPKPAMPDPTKQRAGLAPDREAEVLALWHKKAGSSPLGRSPTRRGQSIG